MYLGYMRPSAVEWTTPAYNANTNNIPWKPWHHVYSMCKAGEGSHNPQVNFSGIFKIQEFKKINDFSFIKIPFIYHFILDLKILCFLIIQKSIITVLLLVIW